ncbi:hypothetical protein KC356_g9134 [Hortaea werneckii]|nr:hypothetical protein KC356_g9134 [Hortaea werneckii]
MDETGVMLSMLGCVRVVAGRNDLRDYRGARVERTTVTAVECIGADGRYLHPMVIWPAVTHRSNWTTFPTPGWHYACTESGYTDSGINLEWLTHVFDPQTKARANGKPRVLICDGASAHEALEFMKFCFANSIILCRLPSHTSHNLQPCDVAVFAPLKAACRDAVERLERAGVNTIGKPHFISLYSPAREAAFTRRNITAGWSKSGLFPFNPQRVMNDLVKPSAEPTGLPRCTDHGSSAATEVPVTPVTPVTAEAFESLHDLIIKEDTNASINQDRGRLHRRLQKLTKAAQTSLARNALQQERIKFLLQSNNEAKARRTTRAAVVGKARVMSYEDIVAERQRRMDQENGGKKKPGARRKRHWPRVCIDEARPEEAQVAMIERAEVDVENGATTPYPGRAPVAQMW